MGRLLPLPCPTFAILPAPPTGPDLQSDPLSWVGWFQLRLVLGFHGRVVCNGCEALKVHRVLDPKARRGPHGSSSSPPAPHHTGQRAAPRSFPEPSCRRTILAAGRPLLGALTLSCLGHCPRSKKQGRPGPGSPHTPCAGCCPFSYAALTWGSHNQGRDGCPSPWQGGGAEGLAQRVV